MTINAAQIRTLAKEQRITLPEHLSDQHITTLWELAAQITQQESAYPDNSLFKESAAEIEKTKNLITNSLLLWALDNSDRLPAPASLPKHVLDDIQRTVQQKRWNTRQHETATNHRFTMSWNQEKCVIEVDRVPVSTTLRAQAAGTKALTYILSHPNTPILMHKMLQQPGMLDSTYKFSGLIKQKITNEAIRTAFFSINGQQITFYKTVDDERLKSVGLTAQDIREALEK